VVVAVEARTRLIGEDPRVVHAGPGQAGHQLDQSGDGYRLAKARRTQQLRLVQTPLRQRRAQLSALRHELRVRLVKRGRLRWTAREEERLEQRFGQVRGRGG
jgi:predicted ATPase